MSASVFGKVVAGVAGAAVAAQAASVALVDTSDILRPPGALDEADFLSRCIKCGRCIEACPYGALIADSSPTGPGTGAPTLSLRDQACRMCQDMPCIPACPTEALHPLDSREDIRMGTAVIKRELCIAVTGMRCEVCYRACPLIDRAITIDFHMRENDAIHSVFEPIVDPEVCTGCGLCVQRCVISTPEVAVEIVRDREKALSMIEEEQAKMVSSSPF